jgi:hypothetical protein
LVHPCKLIRLILDLLEILVHLLLSEQIVVQYFIPPHLLLMQCLIRDFDRLHLLINGVNLIFELHLVVRVL